MKYDSSEQQGKRQDQVESSEMIVYYSIIIGIATAVVCLIFKI